MQKTLHSRLCHYFAARRRLKRKSPPPFEGLIVGCAGCPLLLRVLKREPFFDKRVIQNSPPFLTAAATSPPGMDFGAAARTNRKLVLAAAEAALPRKVENRHKRSLSSLLSLDARAHTASEFHCGGGQLFDQE